MDISIIKSVVDEIQKDFSKRTFSKTVPIFSFEGLPGAGKTTQIKKASSDLEAVFGKSYYIDLPTKSSVGLLLRALYSNKPIWKQVHKEHPWMNPVLLSMDLRLAVEEAESVDSKYILMSRGILSTYYYNFNTFHDRYGDFEKAWDELHKLLEGFVLPDVIIFFDLSPEEAHERVVKRNREPLREMDMVDKMKSDLVLFEKFIDRLDKNIPIHYINGSMSKDQVTENIRKILSNYMEGIHESME